ncbi:MAG TPA: urease subunit gamma [Actinomycetes bacterium]|nr:urease subunit gamma [Actinomycetes bacterium]
MRLTPTERDRLLIASAAQLARRRQARGLKLNAPEATAIVADAVIEAARDGARLREAVEAGQHALSADDVMDGVAALVPDVWVEAVFDDGSRLVVVSEPFGPAGQAGQPGHVAVHNEEIPDLEPTLELTVENTSDVPISVTSHFHFFEVNPRLRFDRAAAYGMRLAVGAGETVRFEPHSEETVPLCPIGGARVAVGFAGLVDGALDEPGTKELALAKARATGFLSTAEGGAE